MYPQQPEDSPNGMILIERKNDSDIVLKTGFFQLVAALQCVRETATDERKFSTYEVSEQ